MDSADVGFVGLAASLVLVAVAVAISLRLRLRLERELVVSVARGLVQLLIVGAALASSSIPRRRSCGPGCGSSGSSSSRPRRSSAARPAVPGLFWIALAANGVTAVIGFAVAFGLGIFPIAGRRSCRSRGC